MTRNLSSVSRRSMIIVAVLCASVASAGELDLLVGDRASNSILRFDAQSGDPLGTFAAMPGRYRPNGVTLGPDRDLYVSATSRLDEDVVLRYDGRSGALLGKFAAGNGLDSPMDLLFGPDGNLYVANGVGDNVLRFDGRTGAFIDVFSSGGGLDGPTGIVFGADGNLYVNSLGRGEVLRYDGRSGAFIDVFAGGEELDALQIRAEQGELSPSAPLFGYRVPLAEGLPGQWERKILAEEGLSLESFRLGGKRRSPRGERRPVREFAHELRWERWNDGETPCLTLNFELRRGVYATSLAREIIKNEDRCSFPAP